MLALLEYFLDWGGSPASSVSAGPSVAYFGGGSGKSNKNYITLSDEYWDGFTSRMQQDVPKTVHFVEAPPARRAPAQREITANEMQLATLRQQLAEAPSIDALKAIAGQIRALKALA